MTLAVRKKAEAVSIFLMAATAVCMDGLLMAAATQCTPQMY